MNQTYAINVSTTEEELPFKVKNQSIAYGIHLNSKSRSCQIKSNEELIKT